MFWSEERIVEGMVISRGGAIVGCEVVSLLEVGSSMAFV